MCGNEDSLLSESVNNHKNSIKSRRGRKLLDEVHRNGIPWAFRDRELFQVTIWLMALGLGLHAGNTRLAKVLDIGVDLGPSVVMSDKFQGLILSEMARKGMVMLVLHDFEPEVVDIGNVNAIIQSKETIGSDSPTTFRAGKMSRSDQVRSKRGDDVGMEG